MVAKTGGPNPPGVASLEQITGTVHLWVSDSSAMDNDPAGFTPGAPASTRLDDPPTIKDLLNPPAPRPPSPEFLHVEAVVEHRGGARPGDRRAQPGGAAATRR